MTEKAVPEKNKAENRVRFHPKARLLLLQGSIVCLLVVLLGAFGAHALKDILGEPMKKVYETAVRYQMFHGLALIVIGGVAQLDWSGARSEQQVSRYYLAGKLILIGIVLFCGSLYALAVTEIKWLGIITPLGGSAFVLGWLLLLRVIHGLGALDCKQRPK